MSFSNIKSKILFILGIFILSGEMFLSASQALEIRVKEKATVQGDTIYLSDIASFYPSKDHRVGRLGGIDVASAPSPGKVFRLNKRFLRYKIGSAISDKDDIRLKVTGDLMVERAAQSISAGQLEDIFKEHVMSHSPWPANRIKFERINTYGAIDLPAGNLHWEVLEKGNHYYLGNVAFTINFRVDGKQIRKVPVSGKISVIQEVVKAARKISKGQLISEDDLIIISESQTRRIKNAVTSLDEIIGKRAVRNIQSGLFITPRMFEDPPLVRKGKRVLIKAENGLIRVTTLGKTLEDGRAGDEVRVINISSGKEIFATVKGPGLVLVSF